MVWQEEKEENGLVLADRPPKDETGLGGQMQPLHAGAHRVWFLSIPAFPAFLASALAEKAPPRTPHPPPVPMEVPFPLSMSCTSLQQELDVHSAIPPCCPLAGLCTPVSPGTPHQLPDPKGP